MDESEHSNRHDPFSENPEMLAKHAIKLIEQHLWDAYRMKVRMGAELEFCVHFKAGAPAMLNAPKMPIGELARNQPDPLYLGGKSIHSRLFNNSRFVTHGYREDGTHSDADGTICKYEMVTDFKHPMPLANLAHAIESLRRELVSSGSSGRPNRDDHLIERLHAERHTQAEWCQENVEEVRFDTQLTTKLTNGLHLNFSLLDANGNAFMKLGDALGSSMRKTTQRYFTEMSDLIYTTPEQHLRKRELTEDAGFIAVGPRALEQGKSLHLGHPCYLENKMPGADCNAYYAVLLQLAAIDDGIGQIHHNAPTNLEDLLNTLEPNLGSRFMAAQEAQPDLKSCHTNKAALTRGSAASRS